MTPEELDPRHGDPALDGPGDGPPNAASPARAEHVVWDSNAVATSVCPHCSMRYGPELRFCPVDGAALRALDDATSVVGRVIADRYHVLEKLGEGGMGQVYLAEHVRMGRRCALKLINPRLVSDAGAIARFDREASSASRIAHPNVAAVYDFGEASDGTVYLAMEYVAGESLKAVLAREGALPPRRAARIAEQIADGLAAAHELDIIHRDLKPDNIMIGTNRDGTDCVKVVDFGIAKVLHGESERLTVTGLAIGTPMYMSPEQLATDVVDQQSDIYSLGLLTFEMLTGSLPFPSRDSAVARLAQPPRTLADVRPDVPWPASLEHVLARALALGKGSRYSRSEDFKGDLADVVDEHWPPRRLERDTADGRTRLRRAARNQARRAVLAAALGGVALGFTLWVIATRRPDPPGASSQVAESPGTIAIPVQVSADTTSNNDGMRIPQERARRRDQPREDGDAPSYSSLSATPPHSFDAGEELKRLEGWTNASTGDVSSARRTLATLPTLLPRLTTADDSVTAYYHAANAHLLLDEPREACDLLVRIEERARRHPYLARAVAAYLGGDSPLACP